jgi:hypothetical protein
MKPGRIKFGYRVSYTAVEAIEIDRANGKNTTKWQDVITKEMTNSKVAFKLLDKKYIIPPPGSKEITWHLIFGDRSPPDRRCLADGIQNAYFNANTAEKVVHFYAGSE